jgi:hypothetical protein
VDLRSNHSQTIAAGFEAKSTEIVATGFEAKPAKLSLI